MMQLLANLSDFGEVTKTRFPHLQNVETHFVETVWNIASKTPLSSAILSTESQSLDLFLPLVPQ